MPGLLQAGFDFLPVLSPSGQCQKIRCFEQALFFLVALGFFGGGLEVGNGVARAELDQTLECGRPDFG